MSRCNITWFRPFSQTRVTEIFDSLQTLSRAIAHTNATVEEMERWLKAKVQLERDQVPSPPEKFQKLKDLKSFWFQASMCFNFYIQVHFNISYLY